MKWPDARAPLLLLLLSLAFSLSTNILAHPVFVVAPPPGSGSEDLLQGRGSGVAPRDDATDEEIGQALTAINAAPGYQALLDAFRQHEDIIASTRVVALTDARLQSAADAKERVMLTLVRQLSLDCRAQGANAAAQRLGVRMIASAAMRAGTPQQFAGVLERFSPLAPEISSTLVREALDTPGITWPKGLLPLMEQLARDWPELGALAAATKMAEASSGTVTPPEPGGAPELIGHWRSTTIVFGSPRHEHVVLRPDGTAENWVVTAVDRTDVKAGRWAGDGATLKVNWEDGTEWSQAYTFFEGQLVFPNVPDRRRFWERIE